jgi:hypothetical protein
MLLTEEVVETLDALNEEESQRRPSVIHNANKAKARNE